MPLSVDIARVQERLAFAVSTCKSFSTITATSPFIEIPGDLNPAHMTASAEKEAFTAKNKISARQIAALLYNLDNPRFLSQKSKITIKEYMANVENRSLLQAGLPPEAILIHKTGDIGKMLGDAGVVYAQNGKKYIIVVLVNRPHNDYSARNLIQEASELVYKRMLQM